MDEPIVNQQQQPAPATADDRKTAGPPITAADQLASTTATTEPDAKTAEPIAKRSRAIVAKSRGKGKSKADLSLPGRKSRQSRASLQFPVGRIGRYLRNGHYSRRIGDAAPVYLAAALEYLTVEMMELAGNAAKTDGVARITPKHLQMAARGDDELNQLWKGIMIPSAGRKPNIEPELLQPPKPKKPAVKPTPKKRKTGAATASAGKSGLDVYPTATQ